MGSFKSSSGVIFYPHFGDTVMSIRFKYKTIQRPDGESCYGPWIPAIVKGPSETVELIFLLDSRADFMILPVEIAEILGLELSGSIEQSEGVDGSVDTIETDMEINVKNAHESYKFRIPIYVLMSRNSKIPPLLGRAGFFDEFEIAIKQKSGKVTLKKEYGRPY